MLSPLLFDGSLDAFYVLEFLVSRLVPRALEISVTGPLLRGFQKKTERTHSGRPVLLCLERWSAGAFMVGWFWCCSPGTLPLGDGPCTPNLRPKSHRSKPKQKNGLFSHPPRARPTLEKHKSRKLFCGFQLACCQKEM